MKSTLDLGFNINIIMCTIYTVHCTLYSRQPHHSTFSLHNRITPHFHSPTAPLHNCTTLNFHSTTAPLHIFTPQLHHSTFPLHNLTTPHFHSTIAPLHNCITQHFHSTTAPLNNSTCQNEAHQTQTHSFVAHYVILRNIRRWHRVHRTMYVVQCTLCTTYILKW